MGRLPRVPLVWKTGACSTIRIESYQEAWWRAHWRFDGFQSEMLDTCASTELIACAETIAGREIAS